MIASILAAASLAAQPALPVQVSASILDDASHAIEAGRLIEAKLLIARAVSNGLKGAPVDRLGAELAFVSGHYAQALKGYRHLAQLPEKQTSDCEKGAIAALEIGSIGYAQPLVECAVKGPAASWRAWNARGVLADDLHDWKMADESYSRALELAPGEAGVINNQGWSMLLRGDWANAIPLFVKASSLDEKSERIANNLELAKTAVAADLPAKRPGETDADWAARLNDAGIAAELLGDKERATAAFTQALDISPVWYDRASNNLSAMGQN